MWRPQGGTQGAAGTKTLTHAHIFCLHITQRTGLLQLLGVLAEGIRCLFIRGLVRGGGSRARQLEGNPPIPQEVPRLVVNFHLDICPVGGAAETNKQKPTLTRQHHLHRPHLHTHTTGKPRRVCKMSEITACKSKIEGQPSSQSPG